jgi:predicted DNA-binding transcriptional regulator YafY
MMKRNNLIYRLTELQRYLTTRRTQKEIAEHFGVDRRTVKRAIDRLSQVCGVSEEKNRGAICFTSSANMVLIPRTLRRWNLPRLSYLRMQFWRAAISHTVRHSPMPENL